MERKVGSGRKGTVDEEEYLLKSITKLVGRFSATQSKPPFSPSELYLLLTDSFNVDDAHNLLPHLLQFSHEHRGEAANLQEEVSDFEKEISEAVNEIWKKPAEAEGDAQTSDSWVTRMQEHDRRQAIDPMEKVAKPEVVKRTWNERLHSLR